MDILNQATARISIEGVDQEFRLCHYYILPGIHLHRTSKVYIKLLACVARHLQLNNVYAWITCDILWHLISLSLSLYTARIIQMCARKSTFFFTFLLNIHHDSHKLLLQQEFLSYSLL